MKRPKISRRAETRPYGRVSAPTGNYRKFLTQLLTIITMPGGFPNRRSDHPPGYETSSGRNT